MNHWSSTCVVIEYPTWQWPTVCYAIDGPMLIHFVDNKSLLKGLSFQFANWTRHYERIFNKKITDFLRLLLVSSVQTAALWPSSTSWQLPVLTILSFNKLLPSGKVGWETRSAFQMRAVQSCQGNPKGKPKWFPSFHPFTPFDYRRVQVLNWCSHIFSKPRSKSFNRTLEAVITAELIFARSTALFWHS